MNGFCKWTVALALFLSMWEGSKQLARGDECPPGFRVVEVEVIETLYREVCMRLGRDSRGVEVIVTKLVPVTIVRIQRVLVPITEPNTGK